MNLDEYFEQVVKEFQNINHINPRNLPNIDLYMDQVTTFMDEGLTTTKRREDDKILTKTMINNYAKNNLLPAPVKKKYSKDHMLTLIFIYYFIGLFHIIIYFPKFIVFGALGVIIKVIRRKDLVKFIK